MAKLECVNAANRFSTRFSAAISRCRRVGQNVERMRVLLGLLGERLIASEFLIGSSSEKSAWLIKPSGLIGSKAND